MKVLAAASTNLIWHVGKNGNRYQLDSITNQVNLENGLEELGYQVEHVKVGSRKPEAISVINQAHSQNYFDYFLKTDEQISYLPNGLMAQPRLYNLALEHALIARDLMQGSGEDRVSISTIGGGHHCELDKPLGFGLVNTMAISAIEGTKIGLHVAVLDLDTHYSNGCMQILKDRPGIMVASIWNQKIDAWSYTPSGDNLIDERVNDTDEYFVALSRVSEKITDFKPNILIYHLGFDVLTLDRMGGVVGFDELALKRREKIVKDLVNQLSIPIVIYRGGGYTNYKGSVSEIEERKLILQRIQMDILSNWLLE